MSDRRGAKRKRRASGAGPKAAGATKRPEAKPKAAVEASERPGRRVGAPDERPPAPWGKAPLAELVILAGIASLLIGLFGSHPTAIGIGVALAGLGGMEVAIREHFAGYRSHTTLLAGTAFVFMVGILFYLAGQVLAVALPAGAAAFVLVFYLARRAFQRASGGLSYRIGR